jgi:dipeptidyl-peptidase-3
MKPAFTPAYLQQLLAHTEGTLEGEAFNVLFNDKDAKKIILDKDKDLVLESAINFYVPDVTTAETYAYYKSVQVDKVRPIALRLNARLVKQYGKISEQVYKSSGLHGPATDNIIKWLEKAKKVTETAQQPEALTLLIKFYKTGNSNVWDKYAVAWTNITEVLVD